jgi:hypothetical protein
LSKSSREFTGLALGGNRINENHFVVTREPGDEVETRRTQVREFDTCGNIEVPLQVFDHTRAEAVVAHQDIANTCDKH